MILEKRKETFTVDDVDFIKKEPIYKGFLSLVRYHFKHRLFEGGMSKEITREIIERGPAVIVLAYDPKRDAVVLIEQIRIAAMGEQQTPWVLELIAGMIEPQEDVEEVARRESIEEAGVTLGRCKQVLNYMPSPGGSTERLYVVVAEVDSSQAEGIHGEEDEDEDIRVHVVSRQQAYQWVEEGVIDNAGSIIALQWLELNKDLLRKEWQ